MSLYHSRKNSIFPKGLTQDSGKKRKFLPSFFFLQKWLDILVDGIAARKEGFAAYKNEILTQLNNLHFHKRFVAYKNAILT